MRYILLSALIIISLFSAPALGQVQDHPLSQIRGPIDVNLNLTGVNITNVSYIFWGNNTNDVNLYRSAADVLGTDDIFRLVTTGTAGALQFVDANARLYRSSTNLIIEASGQLRIPQNTNITGALYVLNNSAASESNGTLYLGKTSSDGFEYIQFESNLGDDGGGKFRFTAPLEIASSSPGITFYDAADPTNESRKESLEYNPSTREFKFSGGKILQDFTNLIRNGGFESFSAGAVGTFSGINELQTIPDAWSQRNGTAFQYAPASYFIGLDIFQGYSSLSLNPTTGNLGLLDQEVKAYKLQPNKTYSVGVWVKVNGTGIARLNVTGTGIAGRFTEQSSSSTAWALIRGNFSTKASLSSSDSIFVELKASGAAGNLAFFDGVQLNTGNLLAEYQETPLVGIGEQTIFGGLRLQRTGQDRGGVLTVDKSVRTRQIEFTFGNDPGWGGVATHSISDPRYNWGSAYTQADVFLELTGNNRISVTSPLGNGSTSLFVVDISGTTGPTLNTNPGRMINVAGGGLNAISWVNGSNIYASSNVYAGEVISRTLALGWANLTAYPTGCPSGQAVISIGDTLACGQAGGVTGGTENYVALWNGTTSLNRSEIYQSGGNIGIGTTNPGNYKLSVIGDVNATSLTGELGWVNLAAYPAACPAGQAVVSIGDTLTCGSAGGVTGGTANYVALWNSTTTLNRSEIYQSGGSIGIGTTNPVKKLDVVGDINTTQNFYVGQNQYYCLNFSCTANITNNGTYSIWR